MTFYLEYNVSMSAEKQIKGVVVQIIGNRLLVRASSAEKYDAETSNALLTKRNGAVIKFSDIQVGDKVGLVGTVWQDLSVNAKSVRVTSLYTHSGTFSGKVEKVNIPENNFTIKSSKQGAQQVTVDAETSYASAVATSLATLEPGMSVQVKGVWERDRSYILARRVLARVRLLNIDIIGDLVAKTPEALTVTANGVIYAINVDHAKFLSKNNKPLNIQALAMGRVRIQGKHIAESPKILATKVKDLFTVV